jgi:hypothetical protein
MLDHMLPLLFYEVHFRILFSTLTVVESHFKQIRRDDSYQTWPYIRKSLLFTATYIAGV